MKRSLILVITFLFISIFLFACGSGGGGGGTLSTPGEETKGIGPGGGTVTNSDGMASVTIPPGALTEDTEISVETVSNLPSGNIGSAYEFGPDETTFSSPVTISIKYDEATLPSGISESDIRLGKLLSNQWQEVADSTVDTSANSVSGTTTSFSVYGVVVAPAFSGFWLALEKGTFWEYRWDYSEDSWAQGSSGSTTKDSGRFRVTLGTPKDINGVPAYEVQVSGKIKSDFLPRWKYLATANNQILGSEDGVSLTVLFDAKTGKWVGGGFFTTFPSGKLIIAENSTMSNDYISGPAVKVSQSASKDQCQYFSDTGSICGDASFTYTKNEYYREGIGPIGYYYYNSFSDCGGNFCSGATWKENVGLVASSLSGDVAAYDLETEPNDSPQTAQPLTLPVTIGGDTKTGDPGYLKLLKDGSNFLYVNIEDWYTFTLTSADTAGITLAYSFTNRENTDLDLYLVDETESVIYKSRKDNPVLNDPNESISAPLLPGRYYIGVQAWSTPSGRIEYTLKVSSATQPAPDSEAPTAPAGLIATAVSSSRIDLSWAASTDNVGVTGYRVERCQGAPCDNFTEIGTSATTTYNDTAGLAVATGYTYRVRAVDAAGMLSSYSNSASDATWSAADTQAPTVPTVFTATAVPALSWSQVDFSWNASTDNVGVAGYKIYFTGGKFVTSATGTSASITDIASNIYVCFTAFAYDAAGNESPGSAQACVTTLPPTDTEAPTVPTGLKATPISASQINLSWNASTDNVGVDSYNIYFGSGTYIRTVIGTSDSMTGLSPGTQYCFAVSARDVVGNESAKSAPACALTWVLPDMTPPTAPTNLTATTMSSSRIDLSLNVSTDNVGVTGYRVERCQGASCSNFAEITTTNAGSIFLYSNTELTAGTSYTYRVRAVDAAGNLSDYSNTDSATTDLFQVQYTLTVSKVGTGSGTVASIPAGINCGTDCTENYNSGTAVTLTATAATGSVFAGWSMECSPTVICPVTLDAAKTVTATFNLSLPGDTQAPMTPANLIATTENSQINLSWSASTDDVGVTGYQVERCQVAGCSNFVPIASPATPSYSNTGLTAGINFSYRVRAVDAANNFSGYSNTATATIQTIAPVAPGNLQPSNIKTSGVTLTWTDNSNNEDRFDIGTRTLLSPVGYLWSQWGSVPANTTTYTIAGLSPASSYTFYVRASNNVGSALSPGVTFTTASPPATTTATTVYATYDNVLIKSSIDSSWENTTYSNSDLVVGCNYEYWPYSTSYLCYASAIYFNLPQIAGKTLDKAVLRLYPRGLPADWNTFYVLYAYRETWNPSTITFNNSPLVYYTTGNVQIAPPVTGVIPMEFDVTVIVQKWASGEWMNYGFKLQDGNVAWPGYTAYRATNIESLEFNSSTYRRPQLYLEYR